MRGSHFKYLKVWTLHDLLLHDLVKKIYVLTYIFFTK